MYIGKLDDFVVAEGKGGKVSEEEIDSVGEENEHLGVLLLIVKINAQVFIEDLWSSVFTKGTKVNCGCCQNSKVWCAVEGVEFRFCGIETETATRSMNEKEVNNFGKAFGGTSFAALCHQ